MPSPYMLLFRNGGPDTHAHLTPAQRTEMMQRWNAWYDGLAAAGKAQQGSPLGLDGRVVTGAEGRVTDGPFAEAKEVVAGFIVVTAANLDEATEIARHCPGLPIGLTVEVRPLAGESPVLKGVAARPPGS